MEKARIKALISGLVQGVGYRFFVQRNAYKLGISGYAKNLWDGKVEVVAEGDKDKILQLIDLLKKGPSLADVKEVKVFWEEYKGDFKNFSIG
jgi:acylphosphatase